MDRINRILHNIEWRWSLVLQGIGVVTSFALPAWAVDAAGLFPTYSPASWVFAGFGGLVIATLCFMGWQWAQRVRMQRLYQANLKLAPHAVNPMATTFHTQRIAIRDLIPPLGNIIEGKTFVDCQIVGPANIRMLDGVTMQQHGGYGVDLVIMDDGADAANAIYVQNCDFRKCQFYNITFLCPRPVYELYWRNIRINCIAGLDYQKELDLDAINPAESPSHLALSSPEGENQQ